MYCGTNLTAAATRLINSCMYKAYKKPNAQKHKNQHIWKYIRKILENKMFQ